MKMKKIASYDDVPLLIGMQLNAVVDLVVNKFKISEEAANHHIDMLLDVYPMWMPDKLGANRLYPHIVHPPKTLGPINNWSFEKIDDGSMGVDEDEVEGKIKNDCIDLTTAPERIFPHSMFHEVYYDIFHHQPDRFDDLNRAVIFNADAIILMGVVLYDMYIELERAVIHNGACSIKAGSFRNYAKSPFMYQIFAGTLARSLAVYQTCFKNLQYYPTVVFGKAKPQPTGVVIPDMIHIVKNLRDRSGYEEVTKSIPSDIFPAVYPDFCAHRQQF